MPAKLLTRRREYQPAAEREQAAPVALHPGPEADEAEPVEPGRPYQAFVESEARKYWEDLVEQHGTLAKPNQQQLRAAAMPILLRARRNRGGATFLPPTVKAHMAVNFMHEHAADRGETKKPYKGPYPNPDYMEALIQYADDTRLSPQKIPLPWHEEPKHPPIYYYVDPITRQPTPMKDALIGAEYVRRPWYGGEPVTKASHIHPSVDPHKKPPPVVLENKLDVYYRLRDADVKIEVEMCEVNWYGGNLSISNRRLAEYKFTPHWSGACNDKYIEAQKPNQDPVEGKARKYWYEMVDIDSLAKPDPQELHEAARQPLLEERGSDRCLPPAIKAHRAVSAVHRRTDREIPLPEHDEPKHPPIYYYIDPITMQPTPREDALIRGDYVLDSSGPPLTYAYYIRPWPGTERSRPTRAQLLRKGWYACYTLSFNRFQDLEIRFYWISWIVEERGGVLKNASAKDFTQIQFYPFARSEPGYVPESDSERET